MLRDEIEEFTQLSGENAELTSISRIGGFLDGYQKAMEKQQWIPCSERLPERNGYYLVTGRQGAVNKRLYKDGYWYGNWAIIAWMPLPEPWRGENNET